MPYGQPIPHEVSPDRYEEIRLIAQATWSNPDSRVYVRRMFEGNPQELQTYEMCCDIATDYKARSHAVEVDQAYEKMRVREDALFRKQQDEAAIRGHVSKRVQSYGEVCERPMPEHLIDNVAYTGAVGVLLGDSQVGKTWVMLSIAAHAATGLAWPPGGPIAMGLRPIPILYIAAEDGGSIAMRLKKWERATGRDLRAAVFDVHPEPLSVLDDVVIEELCEVIVERGYRLIVVDTVSSSLAGEEEGNAEFAKMVRNMRKLVAAMDGRGVVFLVHHFGKDHSKGARGGSSLFADVDIMWELHGDMDSMTMVNKKWKIDSQRAPFNLTLDRSDKDAIYIKKAQGSFSHASVATESPYKQLTTKILEVVEAKADQNRGFGPTHNVIKDALRKMSGLTFKDTDLSPQLEGLVADRQLYMTPGPNRARFYRLPGVQMELSDSGDSR